jgi:hypothetical protein
MGTRKASSLAPNFSTFHQLMEALRLLTEKDNPQLEERVRSLPVPGSMLALVRQANGQANKLLGSKLRDWVPEDMIDASLVDPYEDALVVLTSTDEAIAKVLQDFARVDVLVAVLSRLREGDLHG